MCSPNMPADFLKSRQGEEQVRRVLGRMSSVDGAKLLGHGRSRMERLLKFLRTCTVLQAVEEPPKDHEQQESDMR